jgi:hypothetical protein
MLLKRASASLRDDFAMLVKIKILHFVQDDRLRPEQFRLTAGGKWLRIAAAAM